MGERKGGREQRVYIETQQVSFIVLFHFPYKPEILLAVIPVSIDIINDLEFIFILSVPVLGQALYYQIYLYHRLSLSTKFKVTMDSFRFFIFRISSGLKCFTGEMFLFFIWTATGSRCRIMDTLDDEELLDTCMDTLELSFDKFFLNALFFMTY